MIPLTKEDIRALIPEAEKLLLKPNQRFDPKTVEFIECLETKDVVACPGSGKTTSLLAKLYILSRFMPFPNNQGICVLTHTNVAINEIKSKLGNAASILLSYPNYVGTIQRFVDTHLLRNALWKYYCSSVVHIDKERFNKMLFRQLPTQQTLKKFIFMRLYSNEKITLKMLQKKLSYDQIKSKEARNKLIELSVINNDYSLSYHKVRNINPDNNTLPELKKYENLQRYVWNVHRETLCNMKHRINDEFKKWYIDFIDETIIRHDSHDTIARKGSASYQQLKIIVDNLLREGIVSYHYAFLLAEKLITDCPSFSESISSRFNYVFIDEMQDTYQNQIDLIDKLFIDQVIMQRIGDPNQAIYSSDVKSQCDWKPRTGYLRLPNSKRFNNQIAQAIKHICVNPEDNLSGIIFPENHLLKPVLILYDNNTIKAIIERYSELISERKYLWQVEVNNPVYWAVGWRHECDELTADDREKTSIKSYWEGYNDPRKSSKSIYDSLLNYLVKPNKHDELEGAKPISDTLFSLFIRVLDVAQVIHPESNRRFTKNSLKRYLEATNEKFYIEWLERMSQWTLKIKNHKCSNLECTKRDIVYPACIVQEIKDYLISDWSVFFETPSDVLNDFFNNHLEEIDPSTIIDNVYKNNGIEVNVGTVHSVKGQTHTATLFLECFSNGFNGNQLKEFFLKNNEDNSNAEMRKINALKISYVAMSRPTHFLCVAFHKDRFSRDEVAILEEKGWVIDRI